MNTLAIIVNVIACGALGYWIVCAEQRLRLYRRQLANLLAHHNNLRQRFGIFMVNGGQDVLKSHFDKEWKESNPLPPAQHGSFSAVQGGVIPPHSFPVLRLEDLDTAPSLPPFPQKEPPYNKNAGPLPGETALPEGTHCE